MISFDFHYCLCKQWAYSIVFLLSPLFYNYLHYLNSVRIYNICMSCFHLCLHIYFSPRSIFKYTKCLPWGPCLPLQSHPIWLFSLYAILSGLLSILLPPLSLYVSLPWFNIFFVFIIIWKYLICQFIFHFLCPHPSQPQTHTIDL